MLPRRRCLGAVHDIHEGFGILVSGAVGAMPLQQDPLAVRPVRELLEPGRPRGEVVHHVAVLPVIRLRVE